MLELISQEDILRERKAVLLLITEYLYLTRTLRARLDKIDNILRGNNGN